MGPLGLGAGVEALKRNDSTHGRRRRFKRACKALFTEFANHPLELEPNSPAHAAALRFRQGITQNLMPDTRSIDLSENVAKALGDRTLADMKTLAPGEAYSRSISTAFIHSVEK